MSYIYTNLLGTNNITLDASGSGKIELKTLSNSISFFTNNVERARITDASFILYNNISPQIPHIMSTPITSPAGSYQQTSGTYTNFFDNASLLRITGFVKQSSVTALLVTINGMFFQSSGAGGGLLTIGANISGTDYDLASAATNTLNSFTSASFSQVIASGLATGTYTIQARWKVDTSSSQWYSVNVNARWVMMVQEIFYP